MSFDEPWRIEDTHRDEYILAQLSLASFCGFSSIPATGLWGVELVMRLITSFSLRQGPTAELNNILSHNTNPSKLTPNEIHTARAL
jgi:hypothetical protein